MLDVDMPMPMHVRGLDGLWHTLRSPGVLGPTASGISGPRERTCGRCDLAANGNTYWTEDSATRAISLAVKIIGSYVMLLGQLADR
jgi:hypothetical protein